MASSRLFLVLALVAVLLCGAVAQRPTRSSAANRAAKAEKTCLKRAGAGCAKCEDVSGTWECTECRTGFDFNDNDRCVCDADAGYGRLTHSQWNKVYKAKKEAGKFNTAGYKLGKHGACVLCDDFDMDAEINARGVAVCVSRD
jgi:hypothetical protein